MCSGKYGNWVEEVHLLFSTTTFLRSAFFTVMAWNVCIGIPRITTLRTYDAFQLPPCPELEALASQLRHLSDMTLPLASASTTWRRCRQFAYKHVSLCISVIRYVIKWILLNCLHYNFYFTVFVVIKIKKNIIMADKSVKKSRKARFRW